MNYAARCFLVFTALTYCTDKSAQAATITANFNRNVNNSEDEKPWFVDNLTSPYQGSISSGGGATTTVTATGLGLTGSATQASGFTDGNGIPDDVAVSFDVQFTVTANMGNLIDGGNNGLGIDSGAGNAMQLDPGEQLFFSTIAISNAMVTADPNGYLRDNSVTMDNAVWRVLRSNDFAEGMEGAMVSSNALGTMDVTGFGTSGSGAINNDFMDGAFGPLASVYISTDQGTWRLKGIGYEFDVTVNAVPEPAGVALALSALAFVACRRRRGGMKY